MRKRIALIVMIFTIISLIMLNYGQPITSIVENDGVIEWHDYNEEDLV